MIQAKENVVETMTLKEASTLLHCRDVRTVRRFCERHSVKIFSEERGKKQYVITAEFNLAIDKNLKSKEGISLLEYIKTFDFDNVKLSIKKGNKIKECNYQPVGQYEKEFLIRLQN